MRRKKPKTFNLPNELTEVATAYAEATGRSFSSLVEDLLREHLAKTNCLSEPTPEQVMERLRERLASAEDRKKRKPSKRAGDGTEV